MKIKYIIFSVLMVALAPVTLFGTESFFDTITSADEASEEAMLGFKLSEAKSDKESVRTDPKNSVHKKIHAMLKRYDWLTKPALLSALMAAVSLPLFTLVWDGESGLYSCLFGPSEYHMFGLPLIYDYPRSWAHEHIVENDTLKMILFAFGLIVWGWPLVESGVDSILSSNDLLVNDAQEQAIEKGQQAFEILASECEVDEALFETNPLLEKIFDNVHMKLTTTNHTDVIVKLLNKPFIRHVMMLLIGYYWFIDHGLYDRLFYTTQGKQGAGEKYTALIYDSSKSWGKSGVLYHGLQMLLGILIVAPYAYWLGDYVARASEYMAGKFAPKSVQQKQEVFKAFSAALRSEKDAWTKLDTKLRNALSGIIKDMTVTDKSAATLKQYGWFGKRVVLIGTIAALLLLWKGTSKISGLYDLLFYNRFLYRDGSWLVGYNNTWMGKNVLAPLDFEFLLFCAFGIPLGLFLSDKISRLGAITIDKLDGSAEKRLDAFKVLIENLSQQSDKLPTLLRPVIEKLHADVQSNSLTQDACDEAISAMSRLGSIAKHEA